MTTILVVDAKIEHRRRSTHILRDAGYDVAEAETGHGAIERAKAADLVLIDMRLPDMNGVEVGRRLRADSETAGIPIAQTSAVSSDVEYAASEVDFLADAYLLQPVDPRVLLASVRTLVRLRDAERALHAARAGAETIFESVQDLVVAETGQRYFEKVTEHLARSTAANCVLIGELADNHREIIVASAAGVPAGVDASRYDLAGTPCQHVVLDRRACVWSSGVAKAFPDDTLLTMLGAESYIGMPLLGLEGQTLGLIALTSAKPLDAPGEISSVLRIVASRAAAEIERRRHDDAVRRAEADYRGLFEHAPDGICRVDREAKLTRANPALAAMLGYASADELVAVGRVGHLYADLNRRREFREQIEQRGVVRFFQTEWLRKDGSRIWVSIFRSVLYDQGPRPWHGTRPCDGLRIRQAERRDHDGVERPRPRRDLSCLPATRQRRRGPRGAGTETHTFDGG